MSNDVTPGSTQHAGTRASDIHLARAQVEAARARQRQLAAVGNAAGRGEATTRDGDLAHAALPGYTLVRELHRGGQGIVYLAVQNSTGRQVALKLLHRELPFGSGSAGLTRFEREIEIVSRLKHPNIVTVHDCGRDHGHVYLVMDYVIGQPLDAWVNRDASNRDETLEVFVKICDGVNAAHLRGVIHRDLKPGNILVDEGGEPHVLDFGLAKLVEESGGGGEAATEIAQPMTITGQFVGSLPWASPEQAEGRMDSLDIRTDVYSLGVILYQLLTGRFPYPVSGRLSEVVRHIVETSPMRPSTIERRIDRELETILLKCLSKEPERRYQSAGDLARDVRRYLAGEAIEARRDSLVYVMGKRLARYRAAMMVAAAMLLIVLGALGFSLAYWRQASEQRTIAEGNAIAAQRSADRAENEAAQARAVTDFMREILSSVEPDKQGADVRLIDMLAGASAMASDRFAAHPQQEAQVRDQLGQVYEKLSLWDYARVEFARAADLWHQVAGPDDPRTLELRGRVIVQMVNLDQPGAAQPALHELLPRLERVLGPDDTRTLTARRNLAVTHIQRGNVDEGERMLLELRVHPALVADDTAQIKLLGALMFVVNSRTNTDDDEERRKLLLAAEPLALEWIERATRLSGPDSLSTLLARVKWAELSSSLGRHDVAAQAIRDVLESASNRLGECHHVITNAMHILAESLNGLGEDIEPANLHLRAIECFRGRMSPGSPILLGAISDSLRYVERAGRAVEGEALARELMTSLGAHGGGHGIMSLTTEMFVAHFVSMQHRLDDAESMFQSLLMREAELLDAPQTRARLHLYFGCHLVRRGLHEQAESELNLAAEVLGDVRRGTFDTHPDDVIRGYIMLYEAWNKPEQVDKYRRMRDDLWPRV